ncbi:FKBP-type peptidyl-prolyl cis-trans isomerase [Gilvimarinus sp. F26214L]|uniref:FKBP-type peptidyl-prolyl cis-trans isomerase n=1 Tax=Gilvimarinus sp. DZF01 TaxID=3461371 RepID=UPI0040467C18
MNRKAYFVATIAAAMVSLGGCQQQSSEQERSELQSLDEKVSYVFGFNIGQQFKSQQIELDPQIVAQAIEDVYSDAEPQLSQEEMQTAMQSFQQEYEEKMASMQADQQAEREAAAADNKQKGEEFLAANAEKEGVVTLPSGLQYKQIEEGEGESPEAADTVTVHYRGTLIDGTEFDSSYERGEPVSFPLQNVIPGWTEGLQHMKEGSKYELYIPSDLAYGPGGSGPVIGPNETLIFEVELLEVDKAEGSEEQN